MHSSACEHVMAARSIALDSNWDVIVIGGGPAGCTAAAAAARDGARTLLLEATGSLGGMGTGGLVPAWCPFSDKQQIIYRGLAQKVFEQCKGGMPHVNPNSLDWVPIDPERLKRIYDELVTAHGAKVLFNTLLAGVETDGAGRVETLIVANKFGLSALRARVYIDCTGDADLCAFAGAGVLPEPADSPGLMPATHCFILTNVDEYAFSSMPTLHGGNAKSRIYDIIQSGKYPLIPDSHLCASLIGPRTVGFNAGHLWRVDNTNPHSVSEALMHGRKMAAQYRDALAEFVPAAFGNAFLVATGSLMGIRETRRIEGDYVLTLDDYLARRSFEDEICRNSYFIDVHWSKEAATTEASKMEQWEKRTYRYAAGESHGLPYRCLTPKGLKNVLTAGRAISCEKSVQGSVRVMPVCLAMGEAAGMAGAIAAGANGDVHAVNVPALREKLKAHGAYLP